MQISAMRVGGGLLATTGLVTLGYGATIVHDADASVQRLSDALKAHGPDELRRQLEDGTFDPAAWNAETDAGFQTMEAANGAMKRATFLFLGGIAAAGLGASLLLR